MEKENKIQQNVEETVEKHEKVCPNCGSTQIEITSRCATCHSCGWSICSI